MSFYMLLGLSLCVPFSLVAPNLFTFLTCTGIPCRDAHCENGLVRCCCLYTSVSQGFLAMLLPSFLSTSTTRDCMTRSCKPCFLRVRWMTLASAGSITVAAAFSCHAFHFWKRPQGTAAFHDHPGMPSFSLDQATFARNASCNNLDTLMRAFWTSIPFLPPFHEKALANALSSRVALWSDDVATDHAQHLVTPWSQDPGLPLVSHLH